MPMHAIDFGRPIPLFPLGGVSLMPHAMSRFHIFEPRYRQMVEHMLAAGNGHSGVVGALLERGGADLDAVNRDGVTALMHAAALGRAAVAAQLVEAGADASQRTLESAHRRAAMRSESVLP